MLALVNPAQPPVAERWPLLANRSMIQGKPTAFVCFNAICKLPVTNPQKMAQLLEQRQDTRQ